MYIILGMSYEEEKNYRKAEENYRNASYLMPHLFVPKYDLFRLYINTRQLDKAHIVALEIRSMKIKVFSDAVKDIKTEVNKYLSSENQ
jgi:O-antigen polymerase